MTEVKNLQDKSEGKDVQLFRVRMRGIFEQIVTGVSAEKFEQIYGEVFQRRQSLAGRLHKRWKDAALDDMIKELDEIIIEEKFDEKLKAKARIIEECQKNRDTIAWRPPGNPMEHIRSLDMKEKIKRKNELEAFVKRKEIEVNQLKKEVSSRRLHVRQFESNLDAEINKLYSVYEREKKNQDTLEAHFNQLTKED